MKITQLSTSSSSPRAGTSSGDRRPSSSAKAVPETPDPSTPTTAIPPPQPSAATSLPTVDPPVMRRLENILSSIPTETDPAVAYAALKAQLGIFRSEDPAPTPEPQIPPPSPPRAQSPPPSPKITPIIPLVQYSGDASDEEEGGRLMSSPSPKTLGQRRAHLPSTSRRQQAKAVLLPSIGPHSIEVIKIDGDGGFSTTSQRHSTSAEGG